MNGMYRRVLSTVKKGTRTAKEVQALFLERLNTLLISAFGLVAALAWNEAIQGIFKTYFQARATLLSQIMYAISVTVIAVFIMYWLSKGEKK